MYIHEDVLDKTIIWHNARDKEGLTKAFFASETANETHCMGC